MELSWQHYRLLNIGEGEDKQRRPLLRVARWMLANAGQ
jgi:hypothetical protein